MQGSLLPTASSVSSLWHQPQQQCPPPYPAEVAPLLHPKPHSSFGLVGSWQMFQKTSNCGFWRSSWLVLGSPDGQHCGGCGGHSYFLPGTCENKIFHYIFTIFFLNKTKRLDQYPNCVGSFGDSAECVFHDIKKI